MNRAYHKVEGLCAEVGSELELGDDEDKEGHERNDDADGGGGDDQKASGLAAVRRGRVGVLDEAELILPNNGLVKAVADSASARRIDRAENSGDRGSNVRDGADNAEHDDQETLKSKTE